jgi:hypothetical protein
MTLPNIDAAQSGSSYRDVPNVSCGFARSGDALKRHFSDLVVSKQKLRRVDAIACVRLKRQADSCKATARWPIPARGRKRPFFAAGDGAYFIWTAVGSGSARSARYVWHATGRDSTGA